MNKVLKTNIPITIINIVRGKVRRKNVCFDLKILIIDR